MKYLYYINYFSQNYKNSIDYFIYDMDVIYI